MDFIRELSENEIGFLDSIAELLHKHNLRVTDIKLKYRSKEDANLQLFVETINPPRVNINIISKFHKELAIFYPNWELTVSSPGMEMNLARIRDLENHVGANISVIENNMMLRSMKIVKGKLITVHKDSIEVKTQKETKTFHFKNNLQISLVPEYKF